MSELADDVIQSASSISEAMEQDLQELEKAYEEQTGEQLSTSMESIKAKADGFFDLLKEEMAKPLKWDFFEGNEVLSASNRRLEHESGIVINIRFIRSEKHMTVTENKVTVVWPLHVNLTKDQRENLYELAKDLKKKVLIIRKAKAFDMIEKSI